MIDPTIVLFLAAGTGFGAALAIVGLLSRKPRDHNKQVVTQTYDEQGRPFQQVTARYDDGCP